MYSDLTKEQLLDLMKCYDRYIIEWFDDHDEGCPVCLSEFYNNEYQIILEDRED